MLVDGFNRGISYLRLSITDRCNLHCIYCVPPYDERKLRHKDILRYEELLRVVRIAVKLGINKIRLTGGEPFVRKGVGEFVPMLTALKGLDDVSLTTNGVYLKDNLDMLKAAGITRINVSIDSLERERFKSITRFDYFNRVWEGIEKARDMGFSPIKLNVVIMKGVNDNEVLDFGRLAIEQPYYIRFIECMPIGLQANSLAFIPNPEIEKALVNRFGRLIAVSPGQNDGPARRFRFDGGEGEIGFISPISHCFCRDCNRLRLTANGMLLPCLLSDREVNIKDPLRRGCLDEELIEIFLKAVDLKPECHPLSLDNHRKVQRKMCSIGG
ncbi:MAG: GTP 3',8-cyclase MoaA [Deltaproteobacteria bacterium]|nr:MAG: GTP 3',8-cyclase MoaA [Deltaproteobacteria bacterium]